MTGYVHSIQSLGASDGPGVRFVVFLSGCPLRCGFCHNPDTWDMNSGTVYSSEEIVKKALKYRAYYGKNGGVTVSGGEPLLQSEFVYEIFSLCRENGLSTALDTSGCILDESVEKVLKVTDTVLLDYKMANDEDYKKYTLLEKEKVDLFLEKLQEKGVNTWIRRVIVEGINDDEEGTRELFSLKEKYSCIEKIELLPFKKFCKEKYEKMGIEFPFDKFPATKKETIDKLYKLAK